MNGRFTKVSKYESIMKDGKKKRVFPGRKPQGQFEINFSYIQI